MSMAVVQTRGATPAAASRAWPCWIVDHHHTLSLFPHPWTCWCAQLQPKPALPRFPPVFLVQGAVTGNKASRWVNTSPVPSPSLSYLKTLLIGTSSAVLSPTRQHHHPRAGALGLCLHRWRIKSSFPQEFLGENSDSFWHIRKVNYSWQYNPVHLDFLEWTRHRRKGFQTSLCCCSLINTHVTSCASDSQDSHSFYWVWYCQSCAFLRVLGSGDTGL